MSRGNAGHGPDRARPSGGWVPILIDRHGVSLPSRGATGEPVDLAGLRELARSQGAEPATDPAPSDEGGVTSREVPPTAPFRLRAPIAARLSSAGIEFLGHDAAVLARLGCDELMAMLGFLKRNTVRRAHAEQLRQLGDDAVPRHRFDAVARRLIDSDLLIEAGGGADDASEARQHRELRRQFAIARSRTESVADFLAERDAAEDAPAERTGRHRIRVVPVNSEGNPLLSLGLMMAAAGSHDGGRLAERYDFVPDWCDRTVPALTGDEPPAIYMFSNYIWSHAWNVGRTEEVKTKSPHSVTIHGGPNTPKYDADFAAFFEMNPHVDIAVHGEGEATFVEILDALQDRIGDGPPDLSVLRDVPGLTFRHGGEIIPTAPRERIADLDTVPSPYQEGLFDSVGDNEITLMTIETNRGCPYGCTFCDWGSATLSRIRKFDLERVFADLEWCARHKVRTIFGADANFGIFGRDVDIARKLVELKERYGYPVVFESSYAKNTVKHLREIIEILVEGGILSTGTLSLQSVDTGTLDAVHRSNIRVDKYDDLAVEFGRQQLPLVIELMMGLPGSTMTSFLSDLQQCIDREVKARVNATEVLMNSPMNDPSYRDEHAIETLRPIQHDWTEQNGVRKKALIVSTSTFSREEYRRMERYRTAFLLSENFAVLRQVSRFVRQETEIAEMELYVRLADEAAADSGRWPTVAFTFSTVVEHMIPPVSWKLFIDEIADYLRSELGLPDDGALRTVLDVQHALLPAGDRSYPQLLELEHDFAAWHGAMLDVKRTGNRDDWCSDVPPLRSFGPASFEVDDPQAVSRLGLGMPMGYDTDSDWELASPVARPMRFRHSILT